MLCEIHQLDHLPSNQICRRAKTGMVFRADLSEDEIVYSHCCIHKHGWQEDVQEEIGRLNS